MSKIIILILAFMLQVITLTACGQSKKTENNHQVNDINLQENNMIEDTEESQIEYIGEQELFRVDFKAKTHAQVQDIDEYYSSMDEKGQFTYSSLIPAELCDIILDAMNQGSEDISLNPLMADKVISQEEFSAITGVDLSGMERVMAIKVDADNDGLEDLIGQYFYGGTGGFSSMQMYKGSSDGEYTLTDTFECLIQNYGFLQYQGKHYLLMEEFDYNTKYYKGYSLYLYEDGKLADGKMFSFVIDDYEMDIAYEDSSYEDINTVKNTLCNTRMPDILSNSGGVIVGTGETIYDYDSNYMYSADIDNDGDQEYYNKYMWYPSNMGTVMMCIYEFEDSHILDDLCNRLSDEIGEGRLYTFWIDEIKGKNILYLYYGENLDFTLYGFLIEE